MMRMYLLVCVLVLSAAAQTLTVRTVATNLHVPWEVLWGPDGWLWVTERNGRISRIHPETGQQHVLTVLADVNETGESGLLGMTLHPDFPDSPYVFVAYTYAQGGRLWERIVRFTYVDSTLRERVILLDSIPGANIHDGCRLLVLPDRTLLITTGDASNSTSAQSLSSLSGKTLRIHLDGTIPADNPFPGSPIWSFGHRNPQGLTYYGGIVYSSEHGPSTDDEVNIIERGRNYGWPAVNGYCDQPAEIDFCQQNNVVEPIAAWTPTIAPCGLEYYASERIREWQHSLLLTTLKASRLIVLTLDSTRRRVVRQTEYLTGQLGRLRDVCVSPDGRVFVATSNRDGRGSPRAGDDRIVELVASTSAEPAEQHVAWWFEPEPLGASALLRFHLPEAAPVQLRIATLLGTHVGTWDFGICPSGTTTLPFASASLTSGVYLAQLVAGTRIECRPLVVLR